MSRTGRSGFTPLGGHRPARTVLAAAVGLLLIGAGTGAGLLVAGGPGPAATAGVGPVPHGPARFDAGIPTGYADDRAGAAAAATGFEYTIAAAGNGLIDPTRILPALAAPDAEPGVTEVVAGINPARGTNTVTTSVPLAVTVTEWTPAQAAVSIWACATITTDNPDRTTSGGTSCGTTDLGLTWQGGDWKVRTQTWRSGPAPDQYTPSSGGPLPMPGALTVFVG